MTTARTKTRGPKNKIIKRKLAMCLVLAVIAGCSDDGSVSVDAGMSADGAASGVWTSITATGAPTPRELHSAIWTGAEMLVWGGRAFATSPPGYTYFDDGARFDPSSGLWQSVSVGGPSPRSEHAALWTSAGMLVWGGIGPPTPMANPIPLPSGGLYDPVSNTWTAMSDLGSPEGRRATAVVWTGSELVVWADH